MVALPLVGGAVGPKLPLDARGLLRSCPTAFPRLEEVACRAHGEMVSEAVRQDRRDLRGGEGVDRELSREVQSTN